MGFGGSVSAMITSLKNNSRGKRQSYFDKKQNHSKSKKQNKNPLLEKKASPEQLQEIRMRLKKENKRNTLLILAVTFIVIALAAVFAYFYF
ncbi:hypothetical protein [Psychroflexus aestuariivivens]|uniref:hypothetical protein n=1 Tax=Psychroflexus aestuariivivens TaxID=1795040 RepID=UPI000FDBC382|nr:hypothetical protein [Psychroflexus aestuariivivens]